MKWSEFFSSAITGAREAGIEIEADEPRPLQSVTAELIAVPAADTSAADAERAAHAEALTAAQARIAALETEARTAKFSALAAEWVGDKATHLAMLTTLEGNDTLFSAYVAQQKAHAEVARQSGLFQAAGSDRSGGGSAYAQIEAKAKALMASEPGLTRAAAIMRVAEADRALYAQYKQEI